MSGDDDLIEDGEPLLSVNQSFQVTRVNTAWEALSGQARSEVLGRSYWDVCSPDEARWRSELERCMTQRSAAFLKARPEDAGLSMRVHPRADGGLALFYRDVSEDRQGAWEREQLAAQRQLALDAAHMGWWTYEPHSRRATADSRFREIFGLAGPDFDFAIWQSLVHPEDFPPAGHALLSAVDRPEQPTLYAEYRIVRRDGVERWIEAHGLAVFDEGRRTARLVVGTVADITERKHSQQALAAALKAEENERRRLQTVLEALPAGVMITDANGRPTQVNGAMARIWGSSTLVGGDGGLDARRAYWPTGRVLRSEDWALARALATGKVVPGELIDVERVDGSGRATIISAAAPILDAEGHIIGGVVAELDVTAQVRAEETARAALERTQQAEDRLRHAHKLEAVGKLAGGVAHDFNNLLTVILASGEFLAEQLPEGDPLHEEVTEVRKAAERAATLVRQLLAFSRKQLLEPRVVDVNELLAGLDGLFRRLLGERHELEIHRDPGPLHCKLDPGQFEQVLVNLVVNSRDAMPEGGRIVIETHPVELGSDDLADAPDLQPGPHVRVEVSDTGAGIPAEVQGRVFEPFFTTKEPGRGTGLGLSTAYGIVKQSGGAITFTSELGRGTRFTLLFPRAAQEATSAGAPAPSPSEAQVKDETVLLVEDEEQVRHAIGGVLRRSGFRVLTASSGEDALRVSERHPGAIELLLTDVIMPKMNGRALAERLCAMRPTLKVLFMSGYPEDEVSRDGTLNPGVFFIRKPMSSEALLARIRAVLRG